MGEVKVRPNSMGDRPCFFDDPAIDQLFAITLAMSAELSVTHDRLDTLERLLAKKGTIDRCEIEGFVFDEQAHGERRGRHEEFLNRIFRIFHEERDRLVPFDRMKSYGRVVGELKK